MTTLAAFLADAARRDPYPLYAEARRASPVVGDAVTGAWALFDHESVKRALLDHDAFGSAVTPPTGKAPDWLVFTDPPRHSKLRAIIARAFTPRAIAALEPRMRQLSRALLAPHLERGHFDLVVDYATPLPVLVIAEMMGIPEVDRGSFVRWSEAIVNLSYSITGGEAAALAIASHAAAKEEMSAYVDELVARRRVEPRDDLLTRLVEAEVEGERLAPDDLLGFFQLLLVAGTETTTNLVDLAVLTLLEHPRALERVRAAPSALVPSVIEEVLRYRSPAQVAFRETKRDVVMHGRTIPRGAFVLAFVGSANRDPSAFADPDRFDVTRAPNPHLAFGHGVHFCMGAPLARLEARVAIGQLLERVKGIQLVGDGKWEPRKGLHVHGPTRLPIRFVPQRGA